MRPPMKAALCPHYGPPQVFEVRDVDDPVAGSRDVVIKIRASAVTVSDTYIRSAISGGRLFTRAMLRLAFGFTKPRRPILGGVLAGEIESIGSRVTRFRVGDYVWAFTMLRGGGYAERVAVPETATLLTAAASNLTPDEAAALPYGGLIAQYFLGGAKIQRGESVAVYGASGAIGTCAVQLAKLFGADVTAVCSGANLDLARSLGGDTVLDYTNDAIPAGSCYDVVFDAVGRRKTSPMKEALRNAVSRPGGRYISVDDRTPFPRRSDLEHLRELAEAGLLRPVIDRRYSLEEIADAHEYVERGHKKGNVIISMT